jgi:hypothetical protein
MSYIAVQSQERTGASTCPLLVLALNSITLAGCSVSSALKGMDTLAHHLKVCALSLSYFGEFQYARDSVYVPGVKWFCLIIVALT